MIAPRVADFIDGLRPIAAELGVAAARDLATHFGGTRLYVPQHWRADLDLNALGEETAQRLCRLFGPERIEIPLMPFTPAALKRFSEDLRGQGCSNGAIARALGVSYRTVTRLSSGVAPLTAKRRRATDERQDDLEAWLARKAG